jgi:hypothetical protein
VALFACEDEIYEANRVIDCNLSAIRALQLLADDLAHLSADPLPSLSVSAGVPQIASLEATDADGRPRYRIPPHSLGVTQVNAIARVYGNQGSEILELLWQNPVGAIPIILQRLKEKDQVPLCFTCCSFSFCILRNGALLGYR